jgi:hypothetical protein
MNSAEKQLSKYQRAVLNELGISCWKKQTDSHAGEGYAATDPIRQETASLHKPRPETASKEVALNKLQQLKMQQSSVSYAGKILCTFTPSLDYSTLVQDVMYALELSDLPVITLTQVELLLAKDYALVWQYGDTLSFSSKQLTTPELSQLNNIALKKQLWQLIQSQLAK